MGRAILSVIAGYAAMFVVVALSFTAVQFGLGTERVFKPGSFEVTGVFMALAVVLSFVAAAVGGIVCAAIARSDKSAMILVVAILVLGIGGAIANFSKPDPGARAGDISPFEAAQKAKQPMWYSIALPFIGAAGVMLAARWWTGRGAGGKPAAS